MLQEAVAKQTGKTVCSLRRLPELVARCVLEARGSERRGIPTDRADPLTSIRP
jgi:hypothetical protein